MAKATESASRAVDPQKTKTRSWLRLPQPCLIAWLPNCRRRIRLKGPDVHRLAPPEQSPPSISWWHTQLLRPEEKVRDLRKSLQCGGVGTLEDDVALFENVADVALLRIFHVGMITPPPRGQPAPLCAASIAIDGVIAPRFR